MRGSVSRTLEVVLPAVCLWMAGWTLTVAQDRPEVGTVKDGAGAQLHLSVSQTEFRCGEVMPLDLTFTSKTPDRYQINLAQYDRSGRMSYERFLLDPKEGNYIFDRPAHF